MNELQYWQRQPGESDKAFQAFVTYRNLEPSFRSITRVVSELNKSRSLIGRWSSGWNWVERAAAWDEEQEIRLLAARVEAKKKMDEEHLRIVRSGRNKAVRALAEFDPKDLAPAELRNWLTTFMEWERLILGEPETIEERRTKVAVGQEDIEKEMEELMPIIEDMFRRGELSPLEDEED
jgi:hypothetical protein